MAAKPTAKRTPPESHEGYVAVGVITGPHGVEGETKVDSLTDNPKRFEPGAVMRAGESTLTVRSTRPHKGALLVRFERVGTRASADALRGLLLEVPEAELGCLAEDQYYRFQLIGLKVRDTEGNDLGTLEEVLDTGANDVYVIRDAQSELLVPAIEGVVIEVNLESGTMLIAPMAGMERRPLKGQGSG